MLKKTIVGILVGGVILFLWQFLSWGPLNIHRSMQEYTANQDEILECLRVELDKEGFYFLPTASVDASVDEYQMVMSEAIGKPWAQVYYHDAFNINMTGQIVKGF